MRARRVGSALLAGAGLLVAASVPAEAGAPTREAGIFHLADPSACFTQPFGGESAAGCTRARALLASDSVAVSPDGEHVYVATRGPDHLISRGSNGVAIFDRDPATGSLRQVGCITEDGTDGRRGTQGACLDGDALEHSNHVVVSPDGRHVYVTSSRGGLALFTRDGATGLLRQIGCFKQVRPEGDPCADARPMSRAVSAAVSPDGRNVYVTSRRSHSVVTFARDVDTGLLSQRVCTSKTGHSGRCAVGTALHNPTSITVAPDGRHAYVTSAKETDAVLVFVRDPDSGDLTQKGCVRRGARADDPCTIGYGLADASAVSVSPDGRHVYVTAIDSAAVSTFARDPESGLIYQTDCIADHDDGWYNAACRPGRALSYASAVAVTPSGDDVFVTGAGDNTLSLYRRNPASGRLELTDCIGDASIGWIETGCVPGGGLFGPKGLALSPDGKNAYVAVDTGNALAAFGLGAAMTTTVARPTRTGSVLLELSCPPAAANGCRGRLRLRLPSRLVRASSAAPTFAIPPGRSASIRVALTRAERRALRRVERVSARVVIQDRRGALRPRVQRVELRGTGRSRRSRQRPRSAG